jgi:hypothetical protein
VREEAVQVVAGQSSYLLGHIEAHLPLTGKRAETSGRNGRIGGRRVLPAEPRRNYPAILVD